MMQETKPKLGKGSLWEFILENPARVWLLNKKGMDWLTFHGPLLQEALDAQDIPWDAFEAEVQVFDQGSQAMRQRALKGDFLAKDSSRQLDQVQSNHHFYERKLLFELDQDLNKILRLHFDEHGAELVALHDSFAEFKKLYEVHSVREDSVFFPAIREAQGREPLSQELLEGIRGLVAEHRVACRLLRDVEAASGDFTPPSDGCATYHKAFANLKELAESVYIHLFKEQTVLLAEVERSKRQ